MDNLNELYSFCNVIVKELGDNAPVVMMFSNNLPRRFLSNTVYLIFNSNSVSTKELYDSLINKYPLEHELTVWNLNRTSYSMPLRSLASPNASINGDIIAIPSISIENSRSCDIYDLDAIMERLRAPGGCPWDAEQTHESLKSSLIEEAYEVLDAIDKKDRVGLIEELGDVLLQIVFHSVLENEVEPMDIDEVSTGIVKKLIYRHPHVFGNVNVASSDEVLVNWEILKNKEKHIESVAESMRRVSVGMPSLMRAKRVQKKAAKVGFDWDNAASALDKISEETKEVIQAMNANEDMKIQEELGDLLFSVVNVARLKGYEPELLLMNAIDKFIARFGKMEKQVTKELGSIQGHSLEVLDRYWDSVKKQDKDD